MLNLPLYHLGVYAGINIMLAVALNLPLGYCGMLTLAMGAFFAVGGYAFAYASLALHWGFLPALGVVVLTAVILSLPLAAVAARLKGDHFVVGSWAVQVLLFHLIYNADADAPYGSLRNLTNGPFGVSGVGKPEIWGYKLSGAPEIAALTLILAFGCWMLLSLLVRSPWGRLVAAMRDDELVLRGLGKRTGAPKAVALALSAAMAAVGGAVYASYSTYVHPSQASLEQSVDVLSVLIVGGVGTSAGPIIGGLVYQVLPELLRRLHVGDLLQVGGVSLMPHYSDDHMRMAVFGMLLVVLVHLSPGGLAELFGRLFRRVTSAMPRRDGDGISKEPALAPLPHGDASPVGDNTQPVVLAARALSKSFGGQRVLEDVSFSIRKGEIAVLRGSNGAGKTTLLNILTGHLEPDGGEIIVGESGEGGTFRFAAAGGAYGRHSSNGSRTAFSPESVSAMGISRTWQDVRLFESRTWVDNVAVAAPRQLGERFVAALLLRHAVHKEEIRVRKEADILLEACGAPRDSGPASAAARKGVAMARALNADAKVLFLDEPLAGLSDDDAVAMVGRIEFLARSRGIPVVIIEHATNLPRLATVATTVWDLEDGRIAVRSPEVLKHPKEGHLLPELESWLKEHAGPGGRVIVTSLWNEGMLAVAAPEGSEAAEIILEVENLAGAWEGQLAFGHRRGAGPTDGISLRLRKGQLAVLQAPNGWGKSSFLSCLSGQSEPFQGGAALNSQALEGMPSWDRAGRGLSVMEERSVGFGSLRVAEALRLSGAVRRTLALGSFGMRRVSELSGGELRRVNLLSALRRGRFSAALLDEPFTSLDSASVKRTRHLLSRLARKRAVLLTMPGN